MQQLPQGCHCFDALARWQDGRRGREEGGAFALTRQPLQQDGHHAAASAAASAASAAASRRCAAPPCTQLRGSPAFRVCLTGTEFW